MPANKRFQFKVKTKAGVLLYSTEDWEFDSIVQRVNGTMEVSIKTNILTKDVGNAITNPMNYVTITIASPFTGSAGIDYFSGYIATRTLNLKAVDNRIIIKVLGHASRLWETLYRDSTTIIMDFSSSGDQASDIAKDVIDKVRALDANYPVNYTTPSVENSTDTIKDKFKEQTAGDTLTRLIFLAYDSGSIWYFYVDGNNVFYFKKAATSAVHKFTFGKDVSEFPELSEDLLQGKNEIFVQYNGGANVKRVADATSITAYGNRSLVVNENSVPDSTTATEIGNAYLAQLLPPVRKVRVTVTDLYAQGIENIKPGDTCKIMNLPTDIQNLLTQNMFIAAVTYLKSSVELELSLQSPLISSQVDRVRQRINKQETDDNSATTYA